MCLSSKPAMRGRKCNARSHACYVRRVDRHRRILDTAAELFYEKGFHGTSVDELGSRAGVSGPALYRQFAGKDEILAALLDEAMDILLSATDPVFEDPRADLERMIRHHVGFAVENRHLVNVNQREDRSLVAPFKRHFDHRRKQYVDGWESAIARFLPDATVAEVAVAAQACLGLIFSIAYWPGSAATFPSLEDRIVEITLAGFGVLGQ